MKCQVLPLVLFIGSFFHGAACAFAAQDALIASVDLPGGRLSLSPDEKRVASFDGWTVALIDLANRKRMPIPQPLLGRIQRGCFGNDGRLVVAFDRPSFEVIDGAGRNSICLFDFATQKRTLLGCAHPGGISCIALSGDGRWLATGGSIIDKSLVIWDMVAQTKHTILPYRFQIDDCNGIDDLSFNGANTLLAVGMRDGTVNVLSVRDWKPRHSFKVDPILAVAQFVEDERLALFWYNPWNRKVCIRDALATGKRPELDLKLAGVRFARSPNGWLLAIAGASKEVCFFDLRMGGKMLSWPAHDDGAEEVVFSKDGGRLYTLGRQGKLKIWDVERILKRK